jgi:peptidoglycan/LPS O-acetylase OafA/YrhL
MESTQHTATTTLAEALAGRENSFNLVRLLAAIAVVIGHTLYLAYGTHAAEPMDWAAYNLAAAAVDVFFVLSGLMLARSFALRPNPMAFIRARFLRIVPAFAVAAVVVAFLLAPLGSKLGFAHYLQSTTWLYPFDVFFEFESAPLSGVFDYGARAGRINEPLWTIKYEAIAYVVFLAAACLGFLRWKWLAVAAWLGAGVLLSFHGLIDAAADSPVVSLTRFGFTFLSGVVAWQFAGRIRLSGLLALAGLAVALLPNFSGLASPLSIIGVGYASLVLGSLSFPAVTAFTTKNDLSYGIYLYGWPVQQILLQYADWRGAMIIPYFALTMLVTAMLAYLSWRIVEHPALQLKSRLHSTRPATLPGA